MRPKGSLGRRWRFGMLSVLTGSSALAAACSLVDVRHNLVAGTQSFIRSYATDLWEVLVPTAAELFGRADE